MKLAHPFKPRIHPAELTVAPGAVVALEAISLLGDVKWDVLAGLADKPVDLICPFGVRTILQIPEDIAEYSVLFLRATNIFDPKITATAMIRVERQVHEMRRDAEPPMILTQRLELAGAC